MKPAAIDELFLAFQSALAGRYSLERELGRGGMGVVYLAREVRLDRSVAIKLLPPELASQEKLRDRFLTEARTAARLSHPYIVPIHSVDEIGQFVFYVMAYVDGETLAQRVAARGPLPAGEAARVLREVAWALAYAHAQGIVHRDVKPANILLERGTERAMVTDFGIARSYAGGLTAVGELLGTPEYMSPEQAAGEALDGRSDLYSLGAVGFFALTGAPPFNAPTTQAILAQQITKPAPALSSVARGVPPSVARVIDRCLAKEPERRFATGEALADELAPQRDTRVEIPVPVRVFIDRRRMGALIAPPAMIVGLGIPLVTRLVTVGSTATAVMLFALLGVGMVGIPLAILLTRLRNLLRHGYGPDDIATALRMRFERHREEFQYSFGAKPSIRERVFRVVGFAGLGVCAASIGAMAFGAFNDALAPVAALSGYIGIIGTAFSARWRRLRRESAPAWSSFWQSKVGRMLGRAAGTNLKQRAVPEGRATELAIAMSAEALFSSFPKPIRESLGDVPAVLRSLEAHAQGARARIEELDAALAQAQHTPRGAASDQRQEALVTDLRSARAKAEMRLADVVTALENVRLDLLRLHAGAGTPESITQDLAAARALGEDADRLLAGVREAEAALKPR